MLRIPQALFSQSDVKLMCQLVVTGFLLDTGFPKIPVLVSLLLAPHDVKVEKRA